MKAITKLKDDARKHEQRGEWEKAIKVYLQVLAAADEAGGGEIELPLYNRVGDLCVRLGRPRDAVQYYEQAADRYAEAGLFNNAIALCNKALRYVPGRAELLRKLGQFSASQGFVTDARRYFMEFADRKFAAGDAEAALAALREYTQVAADAEVSELLGRKLHAQGQTAEGINELKRAYALRLGAGQAELAAALRREVLSIEPAAFDDELAGGTVPVHAQPAMRPSLAESLPALEDAPAPPSPEPEPRPATVVEATTPAPELRVDTFGPGEDELEPETGGLLEGFESTGLGEADFNFDTGQQLAGLESATEFSAEELNVESLSDLGGEPALDTVSGEPSQDELFPEFELPGPLEDADEIPPDVDIPLIGGELDADQLPLIGDLPVLEGTEEFAGAALLPLDLADRLVDASLGDLPLLDDAGPGEELPPLDGPVEPLVDLPLLPDQLEPLPELAPIAAEAGVPPELPVSEEKPEELAELPPAESGTATAAAPGAGEFIDLGALLTEDEPPAGTRFTMQEQAPTGDEDEDFAELLAHFRQNVARSMSPEDAAAHYDLGLAFKDMGLLDDAIGELQVALQSDEIRLKVLEELGHCFLLKKEFRIAEKVLRRALTVAHRDELELLGVYFHLGRAYEEQGKSEQARDAYERVLALDINFGDVAERIERL